MAGIIVRLFHLGMKLKLGMQGDGTQLRAWMHSGAGSLVAVPKAAAPKHCSCGGCAVVLATSAYRHCCSGDRMPRAGNLVKREFEMMFRAR